MKFLSAPNGFFHLKTTEHELGSNLKLLGESMYEFFKQNKEDSDIFEVPYHVQAGTAQYNLKINYER